MKIAVASSGLGHVFRGIETWAEDLAGALASRGEDVRLCKGAGSLDQDYERVIPCWTRESAAAVRVRDALPHALAWRIGVGSGYGVEQASFAPGLLRMLRRERIDVLHVQDPLLALIAQRARGLGLIPTRTILAHGTEESPAFQSRIRYLQHLAPWHLEEARSGGFARDSWTVIPNFVDTEAFRPGRSESLRRELEIPEEALVFLSVAAIKRDHKRIDHLVGEFARVIESNPALPAILVVAGGQEAETDALIAEGIARLGRRARFLVRFPRIRMAELYRMADVFALASLKEMMPIALLEALASGLPCLVHGHPVMRWMIGQGGLAIDMGTRGVLAATLSGLLQRPEERRQVGALARARALEEFGTDRVVDRVLTYYAKVLDRGGSRVLGPGESRIHGDALG